MKDSEIKQGIYGFYNYLIFIFSKNVLIEDNNLAYLYLISKYYFKLECLKAPTNTLEISFNFNVKHLLIFYIVKTHGKNST